MTRRPLPRPRRARWALTAVIMTMTLLPMETPTLTTHAAEPTVTDRRRPDPCAQLAAGLGNARIEKRCQFGGGSGVARGDFNGDGIGDLAIGVPYENVDGGNDAGAVNVIYGSATGLTSAGNQFITQNSPGVPGVAESGDHFGRTLAAVNQNGDGFSELAIGVPQENGDEGLVQMMIGSAAGLVAGPAYTFDSMEGGDCHCAFGSALAWGDFNNDLLGDLVIGMPDYVREIPNSIPFHPPFKGRIGAVIVQYSDIGDHQLLENRHEDSLGFTTGFGLALAAGDHDGDGFDELAIGVPSADVDCTFSLDVYCQTVSSSFEPGAVHLYTGRGSGLQYWKDLYQGDNHGVDFAHTAGGLSENGDQFGRALAFGDFDGDGRDELVVGAPYENVGDRNDVGAVSIFYDLAPVGPVRADRTFTQNDLSGVIAQSGDLFGRALAAADFDGDGREDLAIGVPGEDHGSPFNIPPDFIPSAGIVHVLYGYANVGLPLGGGRSQIWHQDTTGVPGVAEGGDQFGFALSAWNFGKTSHRDLAIGVPYENIENKADAGAVLVLYGSGIGLTVNGVQSWSQDSPGIIDVASTDDRFGAALY